MKRWCWTVALMMASGLFADVYLIDGERVEGEVHEEGGIKTICTDTMCMEIPEDAICLEGPVMKSAAPESTVDEPPADIAPAAEAVAVEPPVDETPEAEPAVISRFAFGQGYMKPDEFLAFVNEAPRHPLPAEALRTFRIDANASGEDAPEGEPEAAASDDVESEPTLFDGMAWWLVLLVAFGGGLAMNLTPCVLPMMPINLMIIGKSAVRGALYGLGIALAYGILGGLAAACGMVFGELQSSPWFNLAMAAIFFLLGLSMLGAFMIDFSSKRGAFAAQRGKMNPAFFAFFMGVVSALLAGACVAPVLTALIAYTAKLCAAGAWYALALPFVFGLGMASPWPFAGAGLQVLPKPGAWMTWVNRLFGVLLIGAAIWYAYLACRGFAARHRPPTVTRHAIESSASGRVEIEISSPEAFTLKDVKGPVFVDCWATWCKNCAAMDRETMKDEAVLAEFERRGMSVIRLQCEDVSLLKKLPVFKKAKGLPAFVIFE